MGLYLHLIKGRYSSQSLIVCFSSFELKLETESIEDWGICRLSLLRLVSFPTVMRSSRGISMAPPLALKKVMSFDRSEKGFHDMVFMFLQAFPSVIFVFSYSQNWHCMASYTKWHSENLRLRNF